MRTTEYTNEDLRRASAVADTLGYPTIGDRVRRIRNKLGLSVRDLAARAQVNKNSVLRLERGDGSHPRTLLNILYAMSVQLEMLVRMDDKIIKSVAIERASDETWCDMLHVSSGPLKDIGSATVVPIRLMSAFLPNGRVFPSIIKVRRETHESSHPGEEFIYVFEGQLIIKIAGTSYELGPKDVMTFSSGERHTYAPKDQNVETVILSVRCDFK